MVSTIVIRFTFLAPCAMYIALLNMFCVNNN